MSLTLDFSQDYLCYDFPERVTFKALRGNTPDWGVDVASAFRAQPGQKERAPTGGVYTGYDCLWLLPGYLLQGNRPRPGDQIISGQQTERLSDALPATWTILSAEYDELDHIWACTAVDLTLAYDLRETVVIRSPIPSQDAAGTRTATWQTMESMPARIQEQSGEAADERGKKLTRKRFLIYLHHRLRPETSWTVVEHGLLYGDDGLPLLADDNTPLYGAEVIHEVTGWRNPDRIDELMVLETETNSP